MLKKIIIGVLLIAGTAGSLVAQSNDLLDELLAQAQARLDSASYLLMVAGGLVQEDSDPATAFQAAVDAGYVSKNRHPDDAVSIEDLSFLVMKTQKIPGGLEWMLFPNPRAAYRELAFREVVNTSAGPGRLVAGDEVVRTLNDSRALKGGRE